jgi:hypothetical protein
MRLGVVLGSAPGWEQEIANVLCTVDVLAVNAAGVVYLDDIAAWGSVHADQLADWLVVRRFLYGNTPEHLFGESFLPGQERETVEYYGPVKWRGSSALYVVQWALTFGGYDRLVLAGVHLTGSTRVRGDGLEPTDGSPYEDYQQGWRAALSFLDGRVQSYGGWTRELLGAPEEKYFGG